jgi:Fe/S biogenesis protein NfuA
MVEFTDAARRMVLAFMEQNDGERALRIRSRDGGPLSPKFELTLVAEEERERDDLEVDLGDFTVLLERGSIEKLEGATVDFVERVNEAGFEVRTVDTAAPLPSEPPSGPIADRVRDLLDRQINPAIAAHGGQINLVDVQGTEVYVQMAGGCQGCALSRMTLQQGVERMILQSIPEVTAIHDVTDHTSGINPYYSV